MDPAQGEPFQDYREELSTALARIDQFAQGATRLRSHARSLHQTITQVQDLARNGTTPVVPETELGEALERALAHLQAQLIEAIALVEGYLDPLAARSPLHKAEPPSPAHGATAQIQAVSAKLGYGAAITGRFEVLVRAAIPLPGGATGASE